MRGAHRGPAGASAGKNARWLAVLAALVIVPLAVIAALIWFFTSAGDLELSAAVLILGAAGLVQALVEGKPDRAWISASVVISSGWQVLSDITHNPDGGLAGLLVRVVALACLGVAVVLVTKDGRLGKVWKAIRARLAPSSGGDG
jgi:hypothetical protein